MKEVKLLRPLDGKPEGGTAKYPKLDAEQLEAMGVVKILGDAKDDPEAKEAEAPENKMEPAPANKAATRAKKKAE